MTITEPARHRLYDKLEGLLGMDDAATLMAHLPPVGWADVATRADLDQLHDRIHTDLAEIRVEMASLRTDLRTDLAGFRDEIRRDQLQVQRQLIFAVIAAALSLLGTIAIAI
ncbi:MAG TPA: hypothetical protein VNQ33_06835 [Acidimicrobiales bacterium]|nr:hypothetical protein [Acidimicrobiales bacterium]